MSQNNPSPSSQQPTPNSYDRNLDHNPGQDGIDSSPVTHPDFKWSYSGKAMRAQWILFFLISILIIAGTTFACLKNIGNVSSGHHYMAAWGATIGLLAILWIYFYVKYLYRTWTIKYELTDNRIYFYQGLFTKVQDTTELLYVEDLKVIVHLWDRLFNGGVGTIELYSSADRTDRVLRLIGVENPQEIFKMIDSARAKIRSKRGLITN